MTDATDANLVTAPAPGASARAIAALVLGILAFPACQLLSPVAWYLGHVELRDIAAGRASLDGQGLARAGQVLGIVGTLLLGLILAAVLFWVAVVVGMLALVVAVAA
jgi:hypothetical protein